MRDLLDQIDDRLREAEKVRNRADEHYRGRPFWPDRRHSSRSTDPNSDDPDSPKVR